jgi:hypothetical protein
VLQFRKWLTIWSDESAKLQDANEKKRCAAFLDGGLKRKRTSDRSKTGLAAMQRARYANRSVEQKTADTARRKAAYWAVQNGVRG